MLKNIQYLYTLVDGMLKTFAALYKLNIAKSPKCRNNNAPVFSQSIAP